MIEAQKDFIKNEVWLLSFGGAFQRNKVYKGNATESAKARFRENIRSYIENIILPTYTNKLDDAKHGAMIFAITENSEIYNSILNNGRLSIGSAQKLLNLLLKYYWCLGWLPEPPHFPVDRIVQKILPTSLRVNWTQIQSLEIYQSIIDAVRNSKPNEMSLAIWELEYFKRN